MSYSRRRHVARLWLLPLAGLPCIVLGIAWLRATMDLLWWGMFYGAVKFTYAESPIAVVASFALLAVGVTLILGPPLLTAVRRLQRWSA